MKARLAGLLRQLGRAGDPEETAAALAARYEEPHRRYHSLAHIADCLDKLDLARPLLGAADAAAVELALWWHDAIYEAKAADNEERSAALFRKAAAEHGLPAAIAARAERLILLTKSHRPGDDPAEQAMIDVDLSILGAPPDQFAAYDHGIRLEYANVPEPAWRERRARVLRAFLDRPRIFATEPFRDRFEAAARRNLTGAVAALA